MAAPRRLWCFTINNPKQGNLDVLKKLSDRTWTTWSVWQWEIGDNGTVHIQGALRTDPKKRWTAVLKLLQGKLLAVRAAHCVIVLYIPFGDPAGPYGTLTVSHSYR